MILSYRIDIIVVVKSSGQVGLKKKKYFLDKKKRASLRACEHEKERGQAGESWGKTACNRRKRASLRARKGAGAGWGELGKDSLQPPETCELASTKRSGGRLGRVGEFCQPNPSAMPPPLQPARPPQALRVGKNSDTQKNVRLFNIIFLVL